MPALDCQQRGDEDPGAGAGELGDVAAPERRRAVPGVGELVVVADQVADLPVPSRPGPGESPRGGPCFLVATGEQQDALASRLELVPVPFQEALTVLAGPREPADECLQRALALFAVPAETRIGRRPWSS